MKIPENFKEGYEFLEKGFDLRRYVLNLLRQIPKGKVTTYKDLALALGDEIATRAVGEILSNNKYVNKYPCYKVVHSNGEVGNYILGKEEKIRRLKNDGIPIKNDKIENLEDYIFKDFKTFYPLKRIREIEKKLIKYIKKRKLNSYEIVAGIDVAYKNNVAKACYISMNKNLEVLEKRIIKAKVNFPYIPTYFYYREGPIILKVLKNVKVLPQVLLIDGNGILHPRKMGIATIIGIKTGIATIGVAKKLLLGRIRGNNIFIKNELRGKVIKLNGRLLYISIGSNIDLKSSLKVIKKFSIHGYPEPLFLAHKFSKF
ncbi:MAG: endonuclease V [Candidatus Aenigmatarchaeota archaeon]